MSTPLNYVIDTTAPQLKTMTEAYGDMSTKIWMITQIKAMLGLGDVKGDRDEILSQLKETADVLYERFKNEKVTVFILFCAKCRARDYKISYGAVKVDAILEAAGEFFRDALYKLKTRAGYEIQKTDKESRLVEDDGWRNVTSKNIMWAWRDSVLTLWKAQGEKALSECLQTHSLGKEAKDPKYHLAICAMLGVGALWADERGHAHFNNNAFESYIEWMTDKGTYYPANEDKFYNSFK